MDENMNLIETPTFVTNYNIGKENHNLSQIEIEAQELKDADYVKNVMEKYTFSYVIQTENCPVHGELEVLNFVSFKFENEERKFCLKCITDLLSNFIPDINKHSKTKDVLKCAKEVISS